MTNMELIMLNRFWVVAVLIFLCVGCSSSSDRDEKLVSNVFFSSCFRYAGNEDEFVKFLEAQKVQEMDESSAKPFLHGREGRAWGANISGNKVAFTWLEDGGCTVFIKDIDAEKLITIFNSKLEYAHEKYGAIFEPAQLAHEFIEGETKSIRLVKHSNQELKDGIVIRFTATNDKSKNVSAMLSTSVEVH